MKHDEHCPRSGNWYLSRACREFSTDGSALGAKIAHTFGTQSEERVMQIGIADYHRQVNEQLTGMEAEQADWDADE